MFPVKDVAFLQNSYYVEHLRVATPEVAVHGFFLQNNCSKKFQQIP